MQYLDLNIITQNKCIRKINIGYITDLYFHEFSISLKRKKSLNYLVFQGCGTLKHFFKTVFICKHIYPNTGM